jgi:hypothetical protein
MEECSEGQGQGWKYACKPKIFVQIFDTVNLYSRVSIPAHAGQLAALEFSPDGTR